MANDTDLLTEMKAQLEEQKKMLAEQAAQLESLTAAASQVPRVAPEALAAERRGPPMPCILCGVVHGPNPDACSICRTCRRPKGQEFYSHTVAPPCPDCGSSPLTPQMMRARGHLPSAIEATFAGLRR
jgi:hypothetical protein